MDPKSLSGSLKVAILVYALDKGVSQQILNNLDEDERKLVNKLLAQMGSISPELIEKVAQEFTEISLQGKPQRIEGTVVNATEKEDEHSDDSNRKPSNLQTIQSLEPDSIIQLVKDEHPQTIAIIIAYLKTEVASKVLSALPDEIKTDVSVRIASLNKVVTGMVDEIDKVFEDFLKGDDLSATKEAGGVGCLAEILNQIDSSSSELIMDEIDEDNPELADELRQNMFVFEDLLLVDDRGLQKVLRSVESQELALALKAASEEVKNKIYKNMSERAAEILQEEIESSGPVRMNEITQAQQGITKIVQDLEHKGELVISGRGGEQLIG